MVALAGGPGHRLHRAGSLFHRYVAGRFPDLPVQPQKSRPRGTLRPFACLRLDRRRRLDDGGSGAVVDSGGRVGVRGIKTFIHSKGQVYCTL